MINMKNRQLKVAFVLYPNASISGKFNGVRSQALKWAEGLTRKDNKVTFVNVWGNYDWSSFDVVHIFGTGVWIYDFVSSIHKYNENIFISPIIDSYANVLMYRATSYLGCKKLRLYSNLYSMRSIKQFIKGWFYRSEHELKYLRNGLNISDNYLFYVPLSFEYGYDDIVLDLSQKEDFCFHLSSFTQERKNVLRLIKSAIKYNFKLVIGGSCGSNFESSEIYRLSNEHDNIKIMGVLTEDEKILLYKKAKVFALPSINEGVGLVALDAAALGCKIVITEIGGPKYYYGSLCYSVDPFSIDSIGESILSAFSEDISINNPLDMVRNTYNIDECVNLLSTYYR